MIRQHDASGFRTMVRVLSHLVGTTSIGLWSAILYQFFMSSKKAKDILVLPLSD
jgi:hypothetical protein